MARLNKTTNSRQSQASPRGELVDLGDLCSRLEDRLLTEEREISEARVRGEDTSAHEAIWVRMLHRYERVCDLLASGKSVEHASAA